MGVLTAAMQQTVEANLGFAHVHSPGTVSNLRSNARIEINVVDPLVRKGYPFKGTGSSTPTATCSSEASTSTRPAGPRTPGSASRRS